MINDKKEDIIVIVTRQNFHEQKQNIKNLINKDKFKFIFFNAEYSNLSEKNECYFDSIKERYEKIVENNKNTTLIFFELLLFEIKDDKFNKKVFKFPIVKRSKFTDEKNLSLNKSTMEYFYILRNHININDSFNKNSISYENLHKKDLIKSNLDKILKLGKPMDKKGLVTKFYYFPKELKISNKKIQLKIKELFKGINNFIQNNNLLKEIFSIDEKEIFDKLFTFNFQTIFKSIKKNYLTTFKKMSFRVEIIKEDEKIKNHCKNSISAQGYVKKLNEASKNITEDDIKEIDSDYFNINALIHTKSTDKTKSLEFLNDIFRKLSINSNIDLEYSGYNFDIFSFFKQNYFSILDLKMDVQIEKHECDDQSNFKFLKNLDDNEYDFYCSLFLNIDNEKEILFEDNKDINFNFIFKEIKENKLNIEIPDRYIDEFHLLGNLRDDSNTTLLKHCFNCEIKYDKKTYKLNELIQGFKFEDREIIIKLIENSNQKSLLNKLAPLYEKEMMQKLNNLKKDLLIKEELGFADIFSFIFEEKNDVILFGHNIFLNFCMLYNMLSERELLKYESFCNKNFPKFLDLNYFSITTKNKGNYEFFNRANASYTSYTDHIHKVFENNLRKVCKNITEEIFNDEIEKYCNYFYITKNYNQIISFTEKNNSKSIQDKLLVDGNKIFLRNNKLLYNEILKIIKGLDTNFVLSHKKIDENNYEYKVEIIDNDLEKVEKLKKSFENF